MATGANDRTVKVWYLDTAKEPETLPHDAPVNSVMFSPDGNTLASASANKVRLWRLTNDAFTAEPEVLVGLERRVCCRSPTVAVSSSEENTRGGT
jgi:WD40 repeat protein